MTDDLEEDYLEDAGIIQDAVEEHGEEWVLDRWYPWFSQLGVLMDVPEKEELPFFDEEKDETLTKEEQIKMAEMLSEYRENLRKAGKQ